jgi:FMN reductase
MFSGQDLAALPHYAPERPERTQEQLDFVDAVRRCDGLVVGTPGYHAGISGLVKNALDLIEDLRGDPRSYIDGRAVGLVVTAAGWQACGVTLSALRGVVHALRGWPTPIGIIVNSAVEDPFLADGSLKDPGLRDMVDQMARQVMALRLRRSASRPRIGGSPSRSAAGL